MSVSPPRPRRRRPPRTYQPRSFWVPALIALVPVLLLIVAIRSCSPQPTELGSTAALAQQAQTSEARTAQATRPESRGFAFGAGQPVVALQPPPSDPFFHPWRLSYAPNLYAEQMQAFLEQQPGTLKAVTFQAGDRPERLADELVVLSALYSVNPRIFLALFEQHAGLVSAANPSAEQRDWAMGFRGNNGSQQGLFRQLRWAGRELRWAIRDYAANPAALPNFTFADGSEQPAPADISLSRYALSRVLAPTTTPVKLESALTNFRLAYTRLFGDPREAPTDWPAPAAPFLSKPMEQLPLLTSFFDHNTPFLQTNGALTTYWGHDETDIAFAYDGHTGWDFAMKPPDKVLTAADGLVVFAGNFESGCGSAARTVMVDHGNGYRTIYLHLDSIAVELGQTITRGTEVGVAGATGCVTGPHLHFQVQFLGRDVDPFGWCGATPDPWANNPAGQASGWLWADMPPPCGAAPTGAIVADADIAGSGFRASEGWQRVSAGYGGGALYAATYRVATEDRPWVVRDIGKPLVAVWQPTLPRAGRYRVIAYIPYAANGLTDSEDVRYQVHYAGGETEVAINGELIANNWADLGTYVFDPAQPPLVSISNLGGDSGRGVWADAVMWIPIGE